MDTNRDREPDLPLEELFRREEDRAFLRALGIAPDDQLLAGSVRPWRNHPLLQFPRPEPRPSDLSLEDVVVRSPLLPS